MQGWLRRAKQRLTLVPQLDICHCYGFVGVFVPNVLNNEPPDGFDFEFSASMVHDVLEGQALDRAFFYSTHASHAAVVNLDIFASDVPHFRDSCGALYQIAGVSGVVHTHQDGVPYPECLDILDRNIFNNAATAFAGLYVEGSVHILENAILDHYIADAAAYLAANSDASVSTKHCAFGDCNVLAGNPNIDCLLVFAGLDRNAIISGLKSTLGNQDIAATVRIESVGIGSGCPYVQPSCHNILAI